MLSLKSVDKSYNNGFKVLNGVDLDLKRGDFIYVVGGSGAGKTSLLKLIATEDVPSNGSVSLFGYDLEKSAPSTLRAIRKSIGYVPQDVRLIPDLSVFENVALSLNLSGRLPRNQKVENRVHEALASVGMLGKQKVLCGILSGGEAQRVAVARALVRNPEILIADEPTGAQDREHTWSLMESFVQINRKGTIVILATHEQDIVRQVRKRCAVLKDGKIHLGDRLCFF